MKKDEISCHCVQKQLLEKYNKNNFYNFMHIQHLIVKVYLCEYNLLNASMI